MGIVNGDDFQMVYSDTPGVLQPNYKLQEQMLEFSRSALVDADVLLYVTDVQDNPDKNADFLDKVKRIKAKVFLIINKIDLTTQDKLEELVSYWQQRLPQATVIPASAREGFNIGGIFDRILSLLPEGEPFYPKDTLTDKTLRFFASEIIREKILLNYDKEIPYCCEIEIDTYKEEPTIDHISATIYVARQSQKGIIIGHKGSRLKRVGQQAREDMERFLDKKVFLQLFVKVQDDWRNSERELRRFGYDPQ
jgi:GTP-binding protein Era